MLINQSNLFAVDNCNIFSSVLRAEYSIDMFFVFYLCFRWKKAFPPTFKFVILLLLKNSLWELIIRCVDIEIKSSNISHSNVSSKYAPSLKGIIFQLPWRWTGSYCFSIKISNNSKRENYMAVSQKLDAIWDWSPYNNLH